jgi:hypothetical protein
MQDFNMGKNKAFVFKFVKLPIKLKENQVYSFIFVKL